MKKAALKWTLTGQFFGYPKCCIDAFVERSSTILSTRFVPELTKSQEKVLDHTTGFVPCDCCSSKLSSPEEKATLITNRVCSYPFPGPNTAKGESVMQEELKTYLLIHS